MVSGVRHWSHLPELTSPTHTLSTFLPFCSGFVRFCVPRLSTLFYFTRVFVATCEPGYFCYLLFRWRTDEQERARPRVEHTHVPISTASRHGRSKRKHERCLTRDKGEAGGAYIVNDFTRKDYEGARNSSCCLDVRTIRQSFESCDRSS